MQLRASWYTYICMYAYNVCMHRNSRYIYSTFVYCTDIHVRVSIYIRASSYKVYVYIDVDAHVYIDAHTHVYVCDLILHMNIPA